MRAACLREAFADISRLIGRPAIFTARLVGVLHGLSAQYWFPTDEFLYALASREGGYIGQACLIKSDATLRGES